MNGPSKCKMVLSGSPRCVQMYGTYKFIGIVAIHVDMGCTHTYVHMYVHSIKQIEHCVNDIWRINRVYW